MKQTPHVHAEWIKAKADGFEIQEAAPMSLNWIDMPDDDWDFQIGMVYRVKPPALKWPETTMTDKEINQSIVTEDFQLVSRYATETGRRIANAAIAHACETGQLVLPDPDRDMKIAQAVKYAVINAWNVANDDRKYSTMSAVNLESIIKEATK